MDSSHNGKRLKEIDVVILTGGQGTRLREIISDRPKTMAEINQRPFLDILIGNVSSYGFRRFILCTCHMADVIKDYYAGKNLQCEILFSNEETPLGTGGAVKNAEDFIQTSPCLVINGDSFCSVNLLQFFDFHLRKGALLSMVVAEAENTKDYGVISLDDSQKIIQFKEKGGEEKAYINAGIYLFEKDIFSLIPPETKYSLEYDLFPRLVDKEFYGYITQERLIDIGTAQRYEEGKRFLRHPIKIRMSDYTDLRNRLHR
ncbi:MAG: nucleotidyltransferase family protein [bacterium]|nr:nucleotidyltransferase family protein [bacterium]